MQIGFMKIDLRRVAILGSGPFPALQPASRKQREFFPNVARHLACLDVSGESGNFPIHLHQLII
jgi:hypothetical protein